MTMNIISLLGLFDTQTGFLYSTSESRSNDIKGIFSDVSSVGHEVISTAKDVVGIGKDVIHEVFDDTGKIVSSVTGDIKDTVVGISKEAGGAIGSVTSNLTLPLAIAAGIVAVVVLTKK